MTRVVFAEPAARDLNAIVDYIAADNPAAAPRVYAAIRAATERLSEFPLIGRPGRENGTREFPISRYPYLVVYRKDGDTIIILAVFHTARDLAKAMVKRRSQLARRRKTRK